MQRPLSKILALFASIVLYRANATWYSEPVPDGVEGMMLEYSIPWMPVHTYFANWNMNLYPDGGYFYSGMATNNGKSSLVWSFWPAPGYNGRLVRCIYMHRDVYALQHIGEGASGSAPGPSANWIKPRTKYTTVLRVFDSDAKTGTAKIGQWLKDGATGEWRHWATFSLPICATGLKGNNGFIENCGAPLETSRERIRGAAWYMQDGCWYPEPVVKIDAKPHTANKHPCWEVNPVDDNRALSLKFTDDGTTYNVEPGRKHVFTINQPEKPALDALTVEDVRASYRNGHTVLEWKIPETAAPQLAYSTDGGKTVIYLPQARTAVAEGEVKELTVYDIFGRRGVFPVAAVEGRTVPGRLQSVEGLAPGLNFEYDVGGKRMAYGCAPHGLDVSFRGNRQSDFSFMFRGYVEVPESCAYTFNLRSCDGSVFRLGGETIIDAPGEHSLTDNRASVHLEKGLYPVEIVWTRGKTRRNPFAVDLRLEWSCAGGEMTAIPFRCVPAVPSAVGGAQARTERYLNGRPVVTDAVFPGENVLIRRTVYPDGYTVDSEPVVTNGPANATGNFTEYVRGEKGTRHFVSVDPEKRSIRFAGEGDFLYAKGTVKGDFEFSCHVASITTAKDGCFDNCWAGLRVCSKPEAYSTSKYFLITATSGRGDRTMDEAQDFGGNLIGMRHEVCPYLKISRKGNLYRAWSSKDGKDWVCRMTRVMSMPDEVYVGPAFRAPSGKDGVVFDAVLDELRLTRSAKSEPFDLRQISSLPDPRYERGGDWIMAADGFWKSYDHGQNFIHIDRWRGLPEHAMPAWGFWRAGCTWGFIATEDAVYTCLNVEPWGMKWKKVSAPVPDWGKPLKLVCDDSRKYASREMTDSITVTTDRGVWVSTDGALTWKKQSGDGK